MKNWKLKYERMGGYDCMSDAFIIYEDKKEIACLDLRNYGQELCELPSDEIKKKAWNNGLLMTAAPKMLEALKEVINMLDGEFPGHLMTEWVREVIKLAEEV